MALPLAIVCAGAVGGRLLTQRPLTNPRTQLAKMTGVPVPQPVAHSVKETKVTLNRGFAASGAQ